MTDFDAQCGIIVGMNEGYNNEEYPALSPFFTAYSDYAIPLAYAYDTELVNINGVTEDYEQIIAECYAELLRVFDISPKKKYNGFNDFHTELVERFK
jgi:hypothetical protein